MRLDAALFTRGLTQSRSQAENEIKLGRVTVNGKKIEKASTQVTGHDELKIVGDQYVSRAALKMASIARQFKLDFRNKTVLDIGSSTGGFTDFALQHGASKVLAVDVGSDQLHPSLLGDKRIELHEKTDIRDFNTDTKVDIVVADVSFISLRKIMPKAAELAGKDSLFIIMCKPQFEAGKEQINKGVIKNSKIRRQILGDFETWLEEHKFVIIDKADSKISGTKGNVERFYKLKIS